MPMKDKGRILELQRSRRAYRRMLGLCADCTKPHLPGLVRCQEHNEMHLARCARHLEKGKKKRGWKLVRVKA